MKPIERLQQYFEFKGIAPTTLEKKAGISNGYFGKTYSRLANMNTEIIGKILDNCPDLSVEWLIMGVGEMTKTKSIENDTVIKTGEKTKSIKKVSTVKGDKKGDITNKNEKYKKGYPIPKPNIDIVDEVEVHPYPLTTDRNQENQQVPLYELEATGGMVPLFNDTDKQTPSGFITIPNLPLCDGATHITGDSMYPLLKSGDIVLYKRVNNIEDNIFWGEMYLVVIDMDGEEYITVKYIQKSEIPKHVRLVSHNQHHSDKNVRMDKIKALAFVKASIRINSMK